MVERPDAVLRLLRNGVTHLQPNGPDTGAKCLFIVFRYFRKCIKLWVGLLPDRIMGPDPGPNAETIETRARPSQVLRARIGRDVPRVAIVLLRKFRSVLLHRQFLSRPDHSVSIYCPRDRKQYCYASH